MALRTKAISGRELCSTHSAVFLKAKFQQTSPRPFPALLPLCSLLLYHYHSSLSGGVTLFIQYFLGQFYLTFWVFLKNDAPECETTLYSLRHYE